MVLTIATSDSAGKVDNWISGRADLQLSFLSRICCRVSRRFRAYVCTFRPGLMVMMAMVMAMAMEMEMVLVTVIIVPEALRQVGWLRQR
jgi:hypothetical protein